MRGKNLDKRKFGKSSKQSRESKYPCVYCEAEDHCGKYCPENPEYNEETDNLGNLENLGRREAGSFSDRLDNGFKMLEW